MTLKSQIAAFIVAKHSSHLKRNAPFFVSAQTLSDLGLGKANELEDIMGGMTGEINAIIAEHGLRIRSYRKDHWKQPHFSWYHIEYDPAKEG